MVIPVVPYPCDRITRKCDRRTCGKDEFQPAGHFKSAVRQISVQIKSRADSRPEINGEHDRQVSPLEARPERHESEDLQTNENDEEKKIKFVVFEHEAKWDAARVPQRRNRPRSFLLNELPRKALFTRRHVKTPWRRRELQLAVLPMPVPPITGRDWLSA